MATTWDVPAFLNDLSLICPMPGDLNTEDAVYQFGQDEIQRKLLDYADTVYDDRETEIGSEQMRTVERLLLLRAIDTHWVNHLTAMENLRTGIGLHAYGQRDPLVAYRTEGHKMFQDLTKRMQSDVVHTLFHVDITQQSSNGGRRQAGAKVSPTQAVNPKGRDAVPVGAGKNRPEYSVPLRQRKEIQALSRGQRLVSIQQLRTRVHPVLRQAQDDRIFAAHGELVEPRHQVVG